MFRAVKRFPMIIIMGSTCHYQFVQMHKIYKTRSRPYCKLQALDEIMIGQQRLTNYKKCTTLVVHADEGGVCARVDTRGVCGPSLHLLLKITVNLKLL